MWNRFCLILETIMKQIITILSILILILPCSCARTIYVPAETVRTERQEADTAKFMALNEKGDTIFRDRFIYINLQSEEKKEYERTIENLRDSVSDLRSQLESVKVDSVPVPYPVERPLSKWEQVKMDVGGIAIGAGAALLVAVIALLVWLIKVKRRK